MNSTARARGQSITYKYIYNASNQSFNYCLNITTYCATIVRDGDKKKKKILFRYVQITYKLFIYFILDF